MPKNLSLRLSLIGALVGTAIFLSPMLLLSHVDDAAFNSYIDGWIRWHHSNFWSFTTLVINLWVHAEGRFMPLNLGSVYLINHLVHNAFWVHAIQIVLVGINIVTIFAITKRLTASTAFGALVASCISLTLQIRFPLDPIAGFEPLLPLTLEFFLLAILGQLIYQNSKNPFVLAWAVVFYAASAMTYEITYAFIFIFVALAFRDPIIRSRYTQSIAFAAPIILLTITNLVLRHSAHITSTDTYALSIFTPAYLNTFWIQFIAGFPLTYAAFQPIHLYTSFLQVLSTRPTMALIICILFFGISFFILRQLRRNEMDKGTAASLRSAFVVGILLWILSVPMMAASPRWQTYLVLGQAYLPAYFEYFGVALVTACVIGYVNQRFSSIATTIGLALVIGATSAITYQTNRLSLHAFQPIWTQGRFALEEAARDGLFADIPAGSTILLDNSYIWDYHEQEPTSNSKYLLYFLTGTKYIAAPFDGAVGKLCPQRAGAKAACDLRSDNIYSYSSENATLTPGERLTRVSRMQLVAQVGDSAPQLFASSGSIVARGAPISELESIPSGNVIRAQNLPDGSRKVTVNTCLAMPASEFPSGAGVIFGPTVYGQETNNRETFRWAQPTASLRLVSGSLGADAILSFGVSSFVSGTHVQMTLDHKTRLIATNPIGTPVRLHLKLPPWSQRTINFQLIGKAFSVPGDPRKLAIRFVNTKAAAACAHEERSRASTNPIQHRKA